MTWGKMDDKFHRNRKVRELRRMKGGREALGDWAFWWSWCLDDPELTGVVPGFELDAADKKSARLLVSVGLWDEVDDGFRFHDFHEYNPRREQLDAKREADRMRIAGKRSASREDVARDIDATREGVQRESPPRASRPVPSRPNPDSHTLPAREATPPTKLDPEHVRAAYVAAYRTATGGKLEPLIARGFGNPIWDELALAVVDAETCARLLASAFADDFCRRQGFTPTVIRGCVDRLLLNGPEGPKQTRASPRGMAPPAASEAHAEVVRKHGGSDGIARTPI